MTRFLACLVAMPLLVAAQDSAPAAAPREISVLLDRYCISCHGPKKQKGKVRLDDLDLLRGDPRSDLLNGVRERLHLEEMPPDEAPQPTAAERRVLDAWLAGDLKRFGPLKLEEKLERPDYGNRLSHARLFSGEARDLPGFTFDRRWLVNGFLFDAKINRLLNLKPNLTVDGRRVAVSGENNRGFTRLTLTNPFPAPSGDGVRDYASGTLNGGHLLTMMSNARELSSFMLAQARKEKTYLPAASLLMGQEWEQARVLAAREVFLQNFMDRILKEMFGNDHEALLPAFVPSAAPAAPATSTPGEATKKAPFHAANPGQEELVVIFHSMRLHERDAAGDAQLIERCERDWFNQGVNERTIQTRVTFLRNYMPEWKEQIKVHNYEQRQKPPVYKQPDAAEMKSITEALRACRKKGDTYTAVLRKCLDLWREEHRQALAKAAPPAREAVAALVDQLFQKLYERSAEPAEAAEYLGLAQSALQTLGREAALKQVIQTLILRTDFLYRYEFGAGEPDSFGRRMMPPREAGVALAYALTDGSPDKELAEAARTGKLSTREDYRREVLRMLKRRDLYSIVDEAVHRLRVDSFTAMPVRKIRFFREFFGYPNLLEIFKDNKRFGGNYDNTKGRLVGEADQWVEHILESDRQVFEQLLTSDRFYVFHSGDNQAMAAASAKIRKLYEYFKDKDWQKFTVEELIKHRDFLAEVGMRGVPAEDLTPKGRRNPLQSFKLNMESYTLRFDKGQASAPPFNSFPMSGASEASTRSGLGLNGEHVVRAFNLSLDRWDYPVNQPAPLPNRMGILTHPAWLTAHAKNTETDPIHRGKWIREKLLAGSIPDVPVTVDAVVPEDPHKTLRERLESKTRDAYCWTCHRRMNPLGLPFEQYDDFGRFRTQESLEHPSNLVKKSPDKGPPHVDLRDTFKTLPVDPRGRLEGTGDASLDGDVTDAADLIRRLAKSERVRQSILRHAFRYFLGRNERLSDSKTLIDADRAYVDSGGSFDAVIVSLLTSDSFIYRKALEN